MFWETAVALVALNCAAGGQAMSVADDLSAVAARARVESGAKEPVTIRFRWQYGDLRGRLSGEGVARVNPPDSVRLDLFTSGEGSMAAALVGDSLATLGELEDVRLPGPAFLYAMAGFFRPQEAAPAEGRRGSGRTTLVYATEGGRRLVFMLDGQGRLERLEERVGSRVTQRIRVRWGPAADWPSEAEYRDLEEPRRVRWRLESVTASGRFPAGIYDLETLR